MGIITAPHFVLIAIVGFFAVVWSLVSMGVIKTRDHSLHAEKNAFINHAVKTIESTYTYLEQIPAEHRDQARSHLHNGELNSALESARINHDVYHFFRNY